MEDKINLLGCVERLCLPDDLFLEACNKLGISNHDDYYTLKKVIDTLEIIVNKNVNVYTFKTALIVMNFTYREYMSKYDIYHNGMAIKLLDKEEFDLLKEVLQWLIKEK